MLGCRPMQQSRLKLITENLGCQQASLSALIPNGKVRRRKSVSEAPGMLVEDPSMRESLRQIVNGFTGDLALQQDMLQECLVRLWRVEAEKPGRTRSWYLQNCRFHVQH